MTPYLSQIEEWRWEAEAHIAPILVLIDMFQSSLVSSQSLLQIENVLSLMQRDETCWCRAQSSHDELRFEDAISVLHAPFETRLR